MAAAKDLAQARANLAASFGSEPTAPGWDQYDLNVGANGHYVMLGYTTTTDPSKAVKKIMILDTGKDVNNPSGFLGTHKDFKSAGADLNAGAGGPYLWLVYTHDSKSAAEPGKVVRALGLEIGQR